MNPKAIERIMEAIIISIFSWVVLTVISLDKSVTVLENQQNINNSIFQDLYEIKKDK